MTTRVHCCRCGIRWDAETRRNEAIPPLCHGCRMVRNPPVHPNWRRVTAILAARQWVIEAVVA
jgi:hypothetical protein